MLLNTKILYQKLFHYPSIAIDLLKLIYVNKKSIYMYDETNFLLSDLIDDLIVKLHNRKYSDFKAERSNNVIFVFNKGENLDPKQVAEAFYSQYDIPFDKLFIFKDGEITFMNVSSGVCIFYANITNLGIRRVGEEYKMILRGNH